MSSTYRSLRVWVQRAMVIACYLCCVVGCRSSTGVSVHGVNYTEESFSYHLIEPGSEEGSVGETIGPFSAGGIVCCYALPNKWRGDLKVRVRTIVWKKDAHGELAETTAIKDISLPPFQNGEPGELWVLREPDGKISIVSSDFQPNNAKWPGKIHGWPVPSLAYQRERWDMLIEHEQIFANTADKLLEELASNPEESAREAWNYSKQNSSDAYTAYRGPEDPKFRAKLRAEYEEMLKESSEKVLQLQKERP